MDYVVGIGNTLRGDDAVGAYVVSRLPRTRNVSLDAVHQLTPDWTDRLHEASRVLFVDADAEGHAPRIERLTPSRVAPIGHTIRPEVLIAWMEAICPAVPEAWLLRVPAFRFDVGAPLSERCSNHAERAIQLATAWLDKDSSYPTLDPATPGHDSGGTCERDLGKIPARSVESS